VTPSTFSAYFENSHDAQVWFSPLPAVTTTNTVDEYEITLPRRWLRLRVELTEDTNHVVAISAWISGTLLRRTQ
jgi:hypothetical protein